MSGRLPPWFKQRLADPTVMSSMHGLLDGLKLHTICQSALCPNIGRCFTAGTATFLILGDVCTRRCTFCAVSKGSPAPVDDAEPEHLLKAVEKMGLSYAVITSVTRDDLPDGGASQFARTVSLLHENMEDIMVEVLVPDFLGLEEAVRIVVESGPQVVNHNVETVPRLHPSVQPRADYRRSLGLLAWAKGAGLTTKSGLMLGLGETRGEVVAVMQDLRRVGCELLTLGQYLQPTSDCLPVAEYIHPVEFEWYREVGETMGFQAVAAGPLVRSSYHAEALWAAVNRSSLTGTDNHLPSW